MTKQQELQGFLPVRSATVNVILRGVHKVRALLHGDRGMSTAEYAIGTVAAAAFAAVLYTVVTGDSVSDALSALVERALESSF